MPTLRGKWKSVFSVRHTDNVPEETHVVSVMTYKPLESVAKVRDEKDDRLLLHPIRRQNRLTARGKNPHRGQAVNRKAPGLSTSSGSNSSSTSTLQDLSSTSPAQERSDELAPGDWCRSPSKTQKQNQKRDGNRDSDDRLRDLPEWLEECTDNLEDAEVLEPAHISQDSDSERLTKVL